MSSPNIGTLSEIIELLTRQILRLEAGGDPSTPMTAARVAAEVVELVATAPRSVVDLAQDIAVITAAIRDNKKAADPALCAALLNAVDALAIGLGLAGETVDLSAVEQARAQLTTAAGTAVAIPTEPAAASSTAWPAPGGAIAAELLAQFVTEAEDNLHEAEESLLELDSDHSSDAVNRLFRALHSLKGVAGYVGLSQLRALSHKLESLLELIRRGRLALETGIIEFLFRGVDQLKEMVRTLGPDGESPRNLTDFVSALDILATQPDTSSPVTQDVSNLASAFREAASQHLDSLTDALRSLASGDFTDVTLGRLRRAATGLTTAAEVAGRPDVANPALEFQGIIARLTEARTLLAGPLLGALNPRPVVTVPSPAAIVAAPPRVELPPGQDPVPSPPVSPSASVASEPASSRGANAAKTMRVDQRKLDEYLNLTGELVIARNSLVHAFRQSHLSSNTAAVKDAVEKVCRIIGDVQNNAMGMRMVPVGTVFQRVPRLVRDVAKQLGKEIDLITAGEETELDKQVAEALSDPLVHLIRNAADHGIESPAVRTAAGKSAVGRISLRAGREGNAIVLDIEDDGGGIDVVRLKSKAIAAGIITPEQADALPVAAANELIFAPGLSTAKVVSDLSGRGVGMDVVRSNIVALGGSVAIRSELGRGTGIRLTLPLTLAVSTVVLVEVKEVTYGLPIDAVRETLKVQPGGYHSLGGGRAITLRGEVIPVVRLGGLVNPLESEEETQGSNRVVVMTVGNTRFGLEVDALKGQQEVVIKPIPPMLGHPDGIGGTTIASDGGIVLILDPTGLLRLVLSGVASSKAHRVAGHHAAEHESLKA